MRFSLFNVALVELLITQCTYASHEQTIHETVDSPRICPLPICTTCPTDEQIHAPGLGFALEMGYGTAVLRHHDGQYQNVARLAGSSAYLILMRNLATGPQNRDPDHIDSSWDKLKYIRRRAQRHLNKILGRPATHETAVLAEMASSLKMLAEEQLSKKPVKAAVLSSPDRIRLTAEEITDVFDYLGMTNLMVKPDTLEDLYDTSAAYAGFGMGLCRNYIDPYVCEREEYCFESQRVLHLDFSPDSLSGTIKSLTSAKDGHVDNAFIDPDLGLEHHEHSAEYWNNVQSRIHSIVHSFSPRITQLLLTGPSVSNENFKGAVKNALHDLVDEEVLTQIAGDNKRDVRDLEFVTARGAAEVAKRRQEGPVRCFEGNMCKRVRQVQDRLTEAGPNRWSDL